MGEKQICVFASQLKYVSILSNFLFMLPFNKVKTVIFFKVIFGLSRKMHQFANISFSTQPKNCVPKCE